MQLVYGLVAWAATSLAELGDDVVAVLDKFAYDGVDIACSALEEFYLLLELGYRVILLFYFCLVSFDFGLRLVCHQFFDLFGFLC